jgi:hypothetical protein
MAGRRNDMGTNSTDSGRRGSPNIPGDHLGEWVELALEAPHGDALGRMLRHAQPEELAWRRIRTAERIVSDLVNGGAA